MRVLLNDEQNNMKQFVVAFSLGCVVGLAIGVIYMSILLLGSTENDSTDMTGNLINSREYAHIYWCSECGEVNGLSSEYCEKCGAQKSDDWQVLRYAKCENCGTTIQNTMRYEESIYCYACGEKVGIPVKIKISEAKKQ